MASYRLEDDLGDCLVYEIRGMQKQESPEDQQKEPVTGVALGKLCPLKVKHGILRVPKLDGGLEKSPVDGGLDKHRFVPYDEADEGAVYRTKCSLNASNLLTRWCERLKPKTGSRTIHPYLNGKDVGLMFKIKPMQYPKLFENMHAVMEEEISHSNHGHAKEDERLKPIDCEVEKIEEVSKIVESPKKEAFEAKIELTPESQELPILLEKKILKMSCISKFLNMEFQATMIADPTIRAV
ncbi:hypothetical protein CRG98_013265 [Punica granatum]|uniref:Uncharacterized protein n=1 Tax=Punica granatum TaxID=22663 RepID=A0A2I0KDQ3_PUNGR|nr:hypothetical protein CRG98_013265 [Punica granatum]